jgi:hypothetical protein
VRGIEFFSEEAHELEKQVVRMGIALGINWSDEAQVRELAREALNNGSRDIHEATKHEDCCMMAKAELFAVAALMLRVMEKSAESEGVMTHGGPAWKAFAHALWTEHGNKAQPI